MSMFWNRLAYAPTNDCPVEWTGQSHLIINNERPANTNALSACGKHIFVERVDKRLETIRIGKYTWFVDTNPTDKCEECERVEIMKRLAE